MELGTALKVLVKAFKRVELELGYTFKGLEGLNKVVEEGTPTMVVDNYKGQMCYDKFSNKDKFGIPLPFLSNKIIIYNDKPMCVPYEPYKFGASLVLPSSFGQKGLGSRISQNERCLGVYFSGGWMDDNLSRVLSETMEENNKIIGDIKYGVSELPSSIEEDVSEIIELLKDRKLPTKEFMADMNLMNKEDFASKYFGAEPVVPPLQAPSSKDERTTSDNYRDVSSMFEEDELSDISELKIDNLKSAQIKAEKMGHYNALDVEQEKEKLKRAKARREAKIARLFVERYVKLEQRGKYESMYDNEDDFDVNDFFDELEYDLDDFNDDRDAGYQQLQEDMNDQESRWESWEEEHGIKDVSVERGYDDDEPPPLPVWPSKLESDLDVAQYGKGKSGLSDSWTD